MSPSPGVSSQSLRADCASCFGLCCVALSFSASSGFPVDKDAGRPCPNLRADCSCSVHGDLGELGLTGCISYDCLGAGQQVAQVTYGGRGWRQSPETAQQMVGVFLAMRRLHEMLWYLAEAIALQPSAQRHTELSCILNETHALTRLSPEAILSLDLAAHEAAVGALVRQASEPVRVKARSGHSALSRRHKRLGRGLDLIGADLRNASLRGEDLRGAYLIAADLREADLSGADLMGADMRDADVRGANLADSMFLTQSQINTAKGDAKTTLPIRLSRPAQWPE